MLSYKGNLEQAEEYCLSDLGAYCRPIGKRMLNRLAATETHVVQDLSHELGILLVNQPCFFFLKLVEIKLGDPLRRAFETLRRAMENIRRTSLASERHSGLG